MKKNIKRDESTTIDMPEVKDIPGQEHIKPPRIREMEDTTISSAGEEGVGIVDDLNDETDETGITDNNSNVSPQERKILAQTDRQTNAETDDLKKIRLDSIDDDLSAEQGDPSDMGADLDIPGSELDDENEDMGEEDEENNSYSLPD